MNEKNKNQIDVVYKRHTLSTRTQGLKAKGCKRAYQARSKKYKKAGVVIFISETVDFITREKEDTS